MMIENIKLWLIKIIEPDYFEVKAENKLLKGKNKSLISDIYDMVEFEGTAYELATKLKWKTYFNSDKTLLNGEGVANNAQGHIDYFKKM